MDPSWYEQRCDDSRRISSQIFSERSCEGPNEIHKTALKSIHVHHCGDHILYFGTCASLVYFWAWARNNGKYFLQDRQYHSAWVSCEHHLQWSVFRVSGLQKWFSRMGLLRCVGCHFQINVCVEFLCHRNNITIGSWHATSGPGGFESTRAPPPGDNP